MKNGLLIILLLFLQGVSHAQDPEFPAKEFILHLRLQSGMVTRLNASPELFSGSVQLVPQVTLIPNRVRAGIIAGGFYTTNKLQGAFGPTVSVKLASLSLKNFGSGGNIHLAVDHLWGSGGQRLLGGGFYADLLNRIVIGTIIHRDYRLGSWWWQGSIAFRVSRVKRIEQP